MKRITERDYGMKRITQEELKIIQMDILSAVDKFCRDNNINYSLSAGTLLGAIRHKGYIPWDDDIDIAMSRDEYNHFEKIFPEVLDGKYELISIYRDNNWLRPYAVIVDNRTIMNEEQNEEEHGVTIDLFPIDDVPDSDDDFKKYVSKLKFSKRLRDIKRMKWRKGRTFTKNLYLMFLKSLIFFISSRMIVRYCDRVAQLNNGKGYTKCYETSFGYYAPRSFDKKVFDEFVEKPFEDRQYMCYKNYDNYLSNTYGDYMTPPPVDKRASTHVFNAYWK